jgi:hypothetical protein
MHAESGGRFAFACKSAEAIHAKVREAADSGCGGSVLTPPTVLSTEGKADVRVTILLDPDR